MLDILATLNDNTKVNIEIQVKDKENVISRSLFYGTGLYHENAERGQEYIDVPKVISIWITGQDIFDEGPFHEKAMIKREYENIVLSDRLELHYIQLKKFRNKCKRITGKLEEWLTFLINENMEEIKMSKNEYVRKAQEEFEYLTGDEETRRLAYLRDKAIRDEADAIGTARRKGIEEGKREGIEEGKREGIEEGKREGRKDGIEYEKNEIARKMLAENLEVEFITKVTGLSEEKIKELKNDKK